MTSRRVFLKQASVTTAAVVLGCADERVSADPDAGAPPDEGVDAGLDPGDAGQLEDAGAAEDAGVPEPVVAPEETPESLEVFPIGVASGDPEGDTLIVWTRQIGSAPLELVVWRMDGASYAAVHASQEVTPAEGGYVHVTVTGLMPSARYRFAFFEKSGATRVLRSPVGRFKALPAPDAVVPVVLGAVACTNENKPFDTLARAAEMEDLDAFLLLGDNAYCDGAQTRGEYRDKWALHFSREESIALRASVPVLATWDDHEVKNDWTPESVDAQQLEAARAAFFEHLPLSRDAAHPERLWKSRRIGRTVEIFVLDCRSERVPSTIPSDDEIYISREQMDWLKQGLAASPCAFKVIMNSVPITRFPTVWNTWQVDRWDAYDAQRTEILSFIDASLIDGVLWVAGDFHLAKTGYVSPEGQPGASQVEVLVGPGAQNENALAFSVQPNAIGADHFDWASAENNITRLELDPSTMTARLVYVNGAGDVIHEGSYTLLAP
jgi:alkaline phosphatase D